MSKKIKSATHSEHLVKTVAELVSDATHKHSDVQLKVSEKIFHCHKLVLALKSPYFDQKLFPSSSTAAAGASSDNQEIVLNDISPDYFDKVLQFLYSGEVELSEENVQNVLRAADVIELTELSQFCRDYLLDSISARNCIGRWTFAEERNLAELALACKDVCLKEFRKIPFSELNSLSEGMIKELLESDELVVESEVDVCETLMTWLKSQTQSGHSIQLYHLLTHVRWSAVPVEYVKNKLVTNSLMKKDNRCLKFLNKVITYQHSGIQFHGLNTFHRSSTGVEQCVVIVGMDTCIKSSWLPLRAYSYVRHPLSYYSEPAVSPSDVLRVSLQRQDHVTNVHTIRTTMHIDVAACVSGKELYITGAGLNDNETWKWESAFGWTKCADVIQGRRRHCATFVNNTSMYVLGGFVNKNKTILDSVEQYNTVTNKWTKVGQLIHATESAAYATSKISIFVFGGNIHNNVGHDRVQVFDTATKLCTELTQRLPQPLRLLKAVMWDKSVIILINNETCLLFDLEKQTFQQRDKFAAGIMHFGLVLENQSLFVIGGGTSQTDAAGTTTWNCSDEVKSVAVMDIINDQTSVKWNIHTKLPKPALCHACCTLSLPT